MGNNRQPNLQDQRSHCYELIDVGFPCVNPTYGRGDRTMGLHSHR
ncbi:hypothetical protein VL20_1681 [Microcystis panniformis FACHB-1757]|uniref:Uncharacterized protein n=1 Tax=Microcystis panniformis FACHB-1757 TaxID=1638788 RepID=A0A0K1RYI1_9CHRO|nr:hypothetical protein VL20_1681 [Microcystis panniformis FACHB-1757]